jgi:hypothetical protein
VGHSRAVRLAAERVALLLGLLDLLGTAQILSGHWLSPNPTPSPAPRPLPQCPHLPGKPLSYFYRHCYRPQHGMFCALPEDLGLGTFVAPPGPPVALGMAADGRGFVKEGVTYKVGDFMFLQPSTWDAFEEGSGSEDDSEDEDSSEASEEEQEEEEAKPAAKGKRQQPARAGGKAKGAAAKGKKVAQEEEGTGEESASEGDDSGDEDFKAKNAKGSTKRRAAKAPAKKTDKKKAKKATSSSKRAVSKGKDVQYADGRKGRFVKGSCEGLRAYIVARVVEVKANGSGKVKGGWLWGFAKADQPLSPALNPAGSWLVLTQLAPALSTPSWPLPRRTRCLPRFVCSASSGPRTCPQRPRTPRASTTSTRPPHLPRARPPRARGCSGSSPRWWCPSASSAPLACPRVSSAAGGDGLTAAPNGIGWRLICQLSWGLLVPLSSRFPCLRSLPFPAPARPRADHVRGCRHLQPRHQGHLRGAR